MANTHIYKYIYINKVKSIEPIRIDFVFVLYVRPIYSVETDELPTSSHISQVRQEYLHWTCHDFKTASDLKVEMEN